MQDRLGPDIPAARFAATLAELVHRLRQSVAGPVPADRPPPCGPRLESAALLVAALGRETAAPELRAAGEAAQAFAGALTSGAAADELEPELDRLCGWLEEVLARVDAGAAADDLAREARWETVAAAVAAAGTPSHLLAALADDLARWAARHADSDLTPAAEADLGRRWRELRRFGDALFLGGDSLLGRLLERDPP